LFPTKYSKKTSKEEKIGGVCPIYKIKKKKLNRGKGNRHGARKGGGTGWRRGMKVERDEGGS